jgi:hypothetical protein
MLMRRISLLLALLLSTPLCPQAGAQTAPYATPDGNLGSWSWDKSRPKKSEESEERELGETSWERLNAERDADKLAPPREEVPKTLTPLQMWRLFRGKKDE